MKNRFLLLVVFLLLIGTTAVLAESTAKIRGETASATFFIEHPNGCTETTASVYVFHNKAYKPGDPPENTSYVEIVYEVYGQPTGEPASDPENCDGLWYYELSGTAPLANGAFKASGLNSATLDTTINVWDGESASNYDIDVVVEWTATDKSSKETRPASAVMDVSSPYLSSMYTVNPISTTEGELSRLR